MSQSTGSSIVRLVQPEAGQTTTIPVDQDNMRMALGFEPDPNSVAKNGQNLEFTFEDGGKLILEGYYDHFASKTLPVMITENGDELPGEDFLASLNEDLLTAAGPGAGGASGSGGAGDYADDPGALIDGISRLGSLGTIYWDRATEVPEDYSGDAEWPGGAGSITVITDLTMDDYGRIVVGVFEDARPYQNIGGDADVPRYGQMVFTFDGSGTTVCDWVNLSGLHEGTILYLGDPNNPATQTITVDASGTARIPGSQFENLNGGVWIKPPENADSDQNITSTLDIRAESSGITDTVAGPSFVIVVDAVADKPDLDMEVTGFDDYAQASDPTSITEKSEQDFVDGWAKDSVHKDGEGVSIGTETVTTSVSFETAITFGDYAVGDGSERHYALVEVPGGEWTPRVVSPSGGVSSGYTIIRVWYDANGNALGDTAVGGAAPEGAVNSKDFYQFEVDNAYLESTGGSVRLELEFTTTEQFTEDTVIELDAGSKAQETPGDLELDSANNVSYTFVSDGESEGPFPTINVDVIDSTLHVNVGWVSEGGKNDKHLGGGSYAPDYATMDDPQGEPGVEGASTKVDGAPINISLSGAGGEVGFAADEAITSFTLGLPADGTLYMNGAEVASGTFTINGIEVAVTITGTTVTFSAVSDNNPDTVDVLGRDLSGLNLVFKPDVAGDNNFNSEDFANGISYSVSVVNTETGASATFSGTTTIVVDAVADRPVDMTVNVDYEGEFTAALPDAEVAVTGTVTFPDTHGSETHFIVLNVSNALSAGWSFPTDSILSQAGMYALFNATAGGGLNTDQALSPTGNGPDKDSGDVSQQREYIAIEIVADGSGWKAMVVTGVDSSGNVTYEEVSEISVFRNLDGSFTYTVEGVVAPSEAQDSSTTLWAKPIAVVTDPGDGEYDYGNNLAWNDSVETQLIVDVVTSGLRVSFTVDEDNEPGQWTSGEQGDGWASAPYGMPLSFDLVELDANGNVVLGGNGPEPAEDAATDKVTTLTFNSVPPYSDEPGEPSQGKIYYQGAEVKAGDEFTFDPATGMVFLNGTGIGVNADFPSGFTFRPADDFSGDVDLDVSSVITSTLSGGTNEQGHVLETWQDGGGQWHSGDGALHVNSVADQAQLENEEAVTKDDQGRFVIEAADGTQEIVDNQETGWFVSTADKDTPITANVTVDVTYTDLDGSETGMVLVAKVDGVKAIDPATGLECGTWIDLETGAEYYVVAEGTIGTDLVSGKQAITLEISNGFDAKDLQVMVRTEEAPDSGAGHSHNAADDVAVNAWELPAIDLAWLKDSVVVKTGWVSEDHDNDKYLASGGHTFTPPAGFDANSTEANGAPVRIAFGDQYGDDVTQVTFSYQTDQGTLLYKGNSLSGGQTYFDADGVEWVTYTISKNAFAQLDGLTFQPKVGYSDEDIELKYTVQIENGSNTFLVSGSTTIVVDAVADLARGVDVSDGAIDNVSGIVTITVAAEFPDSAAGDLSEAHYILLEAVDGWTVIGGTLVTVIVDANGNPVHPIGYENGAYTYPAVDDSTYFTKDFWKVAADDSGATDIRMQPQTPGVIPAEDYNLKVVVVSEETQINGEEYDYSNNLAFVNGTATVDLLNSTVTVKTETVYEDHMPKGNVGGGVVLNNNISVNLVNADGSSGSNADALDTAPGKEITITFKFADSDVTGGSLTVMGVGGEKTFSFNDNNLSGPDADGYYTYTFPSEGLQTNATGGLDIRYNPPANDDTDLTNVSITIPVISGSGQTGTLTTVETTVVVDAVADLPVNLKGGIDADDALQSMVNEPKGWQESSSWKQSTGVETTKITPTYEQEAHEFKVSVTANFTDLDGSEKHYLVVENPKGALSVASTVEELAAMGLKLVTDSSGNPQLLYMDASGSPCNASGALYTTPQPNGSSYFQFEALDNTAGTVAGEIVLSGTVTGDTTYTIKTGALSVEAGAGTSGSEPDASNNVAFTQGDTLTATVDAVMSTLTVTMGWAPEDNNAAQHTTGGYNATSGSLGTGYGKVGSGWVDMDGNAVANDTYAAKIQFALSNGTEDNFTTIELSFAEGSGEFIYKGSANYTVGITTANGTTTVVITYNGNSNVSTDNFYFIPKVGNSDEDVNMTFKATVEGRDANTVTYAGSSTITVDAVADLPKNLEVETQGGYEEAAQSAAQPGEKVTLTIKEVTFDDYTDSSNEQHYLLISTKAADGTALTLADQIVTITGGGVSTTVNITGSGVQTVVVNDVEYYKIPVDNAFLASSGGTVSATVDIIAPDPGTAGDTTYRVSVGALAAEESATDRKTGNSSGASGDREVDAVNNTAITIKDVEFDVAVVTSELTLTLITNRVYENGTPLDYLGDGRVGGFDYSAPAQGEYTQHDFAEGPVAAGAQIQVNDLADNETATITFTMTGGLVPEWTGNAADIPEGYYGAIYAADGSKLGDFDKDGNCTITVVGDGSVQNVYFVPGVNYSSENVSLTWTASVTDNDSGHTKGAESDEAMNIIVDAVANAAVLGERTVDGNDLQDGVFYAQGASSIKMEVKATFHDEDGTEQHFILIEAVKGVSLSDAFHDAFAAAGYDFSNPQNLHYERDATTGEIVGVYYKVPADLAGDPSLQDYISRDAATGEVTVTVEMDFTGGNDQSFEISTGAMTVDRDPDTQIGGYYDTDGIWVSEEQSESKRNDVSITLEKPVAIVISQATATGDVSSVAVAEDGRPEAHKTIGGEQVGVELAPSFSAGTHDAINAPETGSPHGEVVVTYDESRGSITYMDGNTLKTLASGDAVPLGADGRPAYTLTYTPKEGVYDDTDTTITYTLSVTDGKSQDTQTVAYTQKVVFDAVAQKPVAEGVTYPEGDSIDFDGYRESQNLELEVAFTDIDEHTDHFVLVEWKAGWTLLYDSDGDGVKEPVAATVIGPDGVVYWQIPVNGVLVNGAGDTATAAIEVTLVTPGKVYGDRWINETTGEVVTVEPQGSGWTKLSGNDSGNLNYGGMSRDNTGGDTEVDWSNNWAFDVEGQIEVDYNLPTSTGTWDIEPAGPAYENDRPLAHKGIDVAMGGTEIEISGEAAGKDMSFSYDESKGTLQYEDATGKRHDLAPGDTYNTAQGPLYYVPKSDSYDDTDAGIKVTIPGLGVTDHDFTVIVDAVAQAPVLDGINVVTAINPDTGSGYSHCTDNVEVKITGTIPDYKDSSEEHFVLIEKTGDIEVPGAAMIIYNDVVYYKVPIDSASIDPDGAFELTVNLAATGGEKHYEVTYGVGSIERPTDGEISAENNLALVISDQPLEFDVALANTSVHMADQSIDENGVTESLLTIAVGASDVVDSITITVSPATGVVRIDGVDLVVSNGTVTIDATSHPALFAQLSTAGSNGGGSVDAKLTFTPDQYENQDVTVSVSVAAHDSRSGDDGGSRGASSIDINAVATTPDIVDGSVDAGGKDAATIDDTVTVTLTVGFKDIDPTGTDETPEHHYILIQSRANWGYGDLDDLVASGAISTVYDHDRIEYLQIPVDDAIRECYAVKDGSGKGSWSDPATGISYTIIFNSDGTAATVEVSFAVTLPGVDRTDDHSYELKFGGQTVDTPYADSNASILDDARINTSGTVTIDVGVVDTTSVDSDATSVAENQSGETNAVTITFTADGAEDVVDTVTVKAADVKNGTLMVNGVSAVADANGNYVFKGSDTVEFVPGEYWSGGYDIPFTCTVVDGLSGAGNGATYTGSIAIDVDAVHTAPVNVVAIGPGLGSYTAAEGGAAVTFSVTATFPDSDASEQHFVLVACKDGWTGAYDTWTDPISGDAYWKIPAGSGTDTVSVTLTAPAGVDETYTFKTGALASEKSLSQDASEGAFTPGGQVSVTVADVQSTSSIANITTGTGSEDPTGNSGRAQLTIGVHDAELSADESVTAITVKAPAGCTIYDAAGNVLTPSNGLITLDVATAKAGGYYFQAGANASGDFSLEVNYTVTDAKSGASAVIKVQDSVTINPVTDEVTNPTGVLQGTVDAAANHSAAVSVKLSAEFSDYDGSEQHFFVVQLPEGISAPAGWMALEATNPVLLAMIAEGVVTGSGTYYIRDLGTTDTGVTSTFTIDAGYNGTDPITYVAGSYEKNQTSGAGYEFASGSVAVTADPTEFNFQPGVQTGSNIAPMADILRDQGEVVEGQLIFTDGDTQDIANISVTGLSYGSSDAVPVSGGEYDGWLAVSGAYGTLYLNAATGAYAYELHNGVNPALVESETFDITIDDGYGAANSSNTSTITIHFNAPNTAPVAEGDLSGHVGGGNEGVANTAASGFLNLTDNEGDAVTVTQVGDATVPGVEGGRPFFEVAGQYGTLRVYTDDNSYIYTLTDEYAQGEETFTVQFEDTFGAANSANIVIDVSPVNHAPEVTIPSGLYESGSYTLGRFTVADSDNNIASVSVAFGSTVLTLPENGWSQPITTNYGTFSFLVDGDTIEYTYTPKNEVTDPSQGLNVWDTVVVTVTDEGGMTVNSNLNVWLGDEAAMTEPPVPSPLGFLPTSGDGELFIGGDGQDILIGGAGDDILIGGAGDDIMTGGDGADTFAWAADDLGGFDTILDFEMGTDKLLFESLFGGTALEGEALTNALTSMVESGGITVETAGDVVTLGLGDQIVSITTDGLANVNGVDYSNLNDSSDAADKAALLAIMLNAGI